MTVRNESFGWHPLCDSSELVNQGLAVPFDVRYAGQTCRAFAIRHHGVAHAYLNRCTHVPMELDWQPNHVFDVSGEWLVCSTHGAHFHPETGGCFGGPCRGGLVKIALLERDSTVWWQEQNMLRPVCADPQKPSEAGRTDF